MSSPETTRRALLDAGRAEFAAHGLAGGRTDRIAAASGVNKQRIYGHFGSKESLFHAVIEDALDMMLGFITLPDDESVPNADVLGEYVRRVNRYHRESPQFLRLLQWEALETTTEFHPDSLRAQRYRDKVHAFAERLNIDPAEAAPLLFGVIGLAAWPQVVPQLARFILSNGTDSSSEQSVEWAVATTRMLATTTSKVDNRHE